MLVLSRRENDKIVFPNLGITVEILHVSGSKVRVGIDAPDNVRVLRHELVDRLPPAQSNDEAVAQKARHQLRNRLNVANLALHLAQRQLEAGKASEADMALRKAIDELSSLDHDVVRFASDETSPATERDPSRRRALVVEDNANERELLAGCLRIGGFDVDTAEDGLSAMRYLSQCARPDVVLLDMRMPRLDGAKTVSAIRCNPDYHGLKIYAVSGSDQQDYAIPIGPRGVDRWFRKPLDPNELIQELGRITLAG